MSQERLSGLDLFSGVGGISQALEPWVKSIAYCERDPYAQAVLLSRMERGEIDVGPIWDDVHTLKGSMLPKIDVILGGFPCQDISVAGRGVGLAGARSGLFFEIVRLIGECRPKIIFLENVPAIRTRGIHTVIEEISNLGYLSRWTDLSAQETGAYHKRNRWFLYATDANRGSLWVGKQRMPRRRPTTICDQGQNVAGHDGSQKSLADSCRANLGGRIERFGRWSGVASDDQTKDIRNRGKTNVQWSIEPDVGRVAHGVQFRSDRLKCLGNAVVPIQARTAFKILSGLNE